MIPVGKREPGMLPKRPAHVAIIISVTPDGQIHVGISASLTERIGYRRCALLNSAIAEIFGLSVTADELAFKVDV